jgi:hypothetical protein
VRRSSLPTQCCHLSLLTPRAGVGCTGARGSLPCIGHPGGAGCRRRAVVEADNHAGSQSTARVKNPVPGVASTICVRSRVASRWCAGGPAQCLPRLCAQVPATYTSSRWRADCAFVSGLMVCCTIHLWIGAYWLSGGGHFAVEGAGRTRHRRTSIAAGRTHAGASWYAQGLDIRVSTLPHCGLKHCTAAGGRHGDSTSRGAGMAVPLNR